MKITKQAAKKRLGIRTDKQLADIFSPTINERAVQQWVIVPELRYRQLNDLYPDKFKLPARKGR